MVNGLTREQCRMARAALEWSQQELSERSGVGSTSIKKFELGASLRPLLVRALRSAMESVGVGFIDEGATIDGESVAYGVVLKAGADRPVPQPAGDGERAGMDE